MRATAIFTVDLRDAIISFTPDKSEAVIVLPKPEVVLSVDETKTTQIAQWQKAFFNGSADDGFDAYLNSMVQIVEHSTDAIANYDELLEYAKDSAKTQVMTLVQSICGEHLSVQITFEK